MSCDDLGDIEVHKVIQSPRFCCCGMIFVVVILILYIRKTEYDFDFDFVVVK